MQPSANYDEQLMQFNIIQEVPLPTNELNNQSSQKMINCDDKAFGDNGKLAPQNDPSVVNAMKAVFGVCC